MPYHQVGICQGTTHEILGIGSFVLVENTIEISAILLVTFITVWMLVFDKTYLKNFGIRFSLNCFALSTAASF